MYVHICMCTDIRFTKTLLCDNSLRCISTSLEDFLLLFAVLSPILCLILPLMLSLSLTSQTTSSPPHYIVVVCQTVVRQVRVEGLVHTKANIVGEQIKGVALATDLKDVSSVLHLLTTTTATLRTQLCYLGQHQPNTLDPLHRWVLTPPSAQWQREGLACQTWSTHNRWCLHLRGVFGLYCMDVRGVLIQKFYCVCVYVRTYLHWLFTENSF